MIARRSPVSVNELLRRALLGHGIDVPIEGEWVGRAPEGPALQGRAEVRAHKAAALTVRLEIRVAVPDGRRMIERFGAAGDDVASATLNAFRRFTAMSFDPIRAGFFEDHEVAVGRDEWSLGGERWRIVFSPIVVEATAQPASADEAMPVPAPPGLIEQVRRLVESRPTSDRDVHWMQIFFARRGRTPIASEATWDGEPWPTAVDALARLSWAAHEGVQSLRMLIVLRRPAPQSVTVEPTVTTVDLARQPTDTLPDLGWSAADVEPTYVPPPTSSLADELAQALEWLPDGSSIDITGPLPVVQPSAGPPRPLPPVDLSGRIRRPRTLDLSTADARLSKAPPPIGPQAPKRKGWWKLW